MVIERSISAVDVKTAVQKIIPYLEDTSNDAPKVIHFGGWRRLGASAVLRAIAMHPPPSLLEKFDKIIHIDSSSWKSQRALQRAIADELNLTQHVAAVFDKQDEEDDFRGVNQGSRAEIEGVMRVIAQSLVQYRCLIVFHDGSDGSADLARCGIPHPKIFNTKVLWTFRGRLRLDQDIRQKAGVSTDLDLSPSDKDINWNSLLAEEAREIALYTLKLGIGVAPEIATECCLYLLSMMNSRTHAFRGDNWVTDASSYWVCDGIIEGGRNSQAWDIARALQRQIRLTGRYSSSKTLPDLGSRFDITYSYFQDGRKLPSDWFHKAAYQLRVLKLRCCTFSFSSPPFHCCHNLRFLGLVRCKDKQQLAGEEEETCALAVEIFQRLWVLDVVHTDWQLALALGTEEQEQVATDIREVHINNGRIWRSNLAWKRLPNLHKLRVVKPTNSWETGKKDEFMDMVKLELLDLSCSTIKVLPSLSGATGLKTLVLDGCLELEQVGLHGLLPSLESFSLETGDDVVGHCLRKAQISHISLAGCARLSDFRLRGSFPNLEELDLSHTGLKMLDLRKSTRGYRGHWENLQRVFLMGCDQLRSISWPETGDCRLRLLCIDTRAGGGDMAREPLPRSSLMVHQGEAEECCRALVAVADMRFLQSVQFLWRSSRRNRRLNTKMNLCASSTTKDDDGRSALKDNMGCPCSTGQLAAGSLLLPRPLSSYHDISIEQTATKIVDCSSNATQFQPLDWHMKIGDGMYDVPKEVSTQGKGMYYAIWDAMKVVQSLQVHDSSYITAVAPEHLFMSPTEIMNRLKWCRVERCSKLEMVFVTFYQSRCFSDLETFWAAHLLMARSVWMRPRIPTLDIKQLSFTQLRAIHLHFCPRLRYVLTLSSNYTISMVLETIHILCSGDLRHVFPVEQEFQEKIATSHESKGMLQFPKLKDLYLHGLSSLQLICEAKMSAPNLETIYIRGCWGLRRLPATDSSRREDGRPVTVDCEKDWWNKLEWDGMQFGHHPSLFQPRHSKYYKKRHLRGTVLQ